ncbi:hypothetical protein DUZ99_12960 [Xylanibacillus composti]|nr:hypothetical protein [Xylanibacillus composti]MDT9725883.1 hypothetical protein [Xylanibacillus composti]
MRFFLMLGVAFFLLAGCTLGSNVAKVEHLPDVTEQESIYIGIIESIVTSFEFAYADFQSISFDWQVPSAEISVDEKDTLQKYFKAKHDCEIMFQSMQQIVSGEKVLFLTITNRESRGPYELYFTGYLNKTGRSGEFIGIQVLLGKKNENWQVIEAGGTWVS